MIPLSDIADAVAREFFVRVKSMRGGRHVLKNGGVAQIARCGFAVVAQSLADASDYEIGAFFGCSAAYARAWRLAGHDLQMADPAFAARIDAVLQALLHGDGDSKAVQKRCVQLAAEIDSGVEAEEAALVEDALRDGPVRDQLELSTLLVLDADRACFAAASAALRRIAGDVQGVAKGRAQEMRRMATRMEQIGRAKAAVDLLARRAAEADA